MLLTSPAQQQKDRTAVEDYNYSGTFVMCNFFSVSTLAAQAREAKAREVREREESEKRRVEEELEELRNREVRERAEREKKRAEERERVEAAIKELQKKLAAVSFGVGRVYHINCIILQPNPRHPEATTLSCYSNDRRGVERQEPSAKPSKRRRRMRFLPRRQRALTGNGRASCESVGNPRSRRSDAGLR